MQKWGEEVLAEIEEVSTDISLSDLLEFRGCLQRNVKLTELGDRWELCYSFQHYV